MEKMRLFTSLIATAAILFSASTAFASATWTVTATTGDGSPLSAVTPGTTLTLDIKLETSAAAEMIAIAGSVNDYDTAVVSADYVASSTSETVLHTTIIPSFGSFGGLTNLEFAAGVNDTSIQGPGQEDTFLSILGFGGAGSDGTTEGPQFTIVYNVIGGAGTSTVLRVGTFANYADAFSGASADNIVNNAQVAITVVPEPGTALLMGLGLAGLAAAGRRE
jgi:hypothetical protein